MDRVECHNGRNFKEKRERRDERKVSLTGKGIMGTGEFGKDRETTTIVRQNIRTAQYDNAMHNQS